MVEREQIVWRLSNNKILLGKETMRSVEVNYKVLAAQRSNQGSPLFSDFEESLNLTLALGPQKERGRTTAINKMTK